MTGLGQPQQPAPYQTADDVEEVSVPLSVAEVRGVDVPVGVVIGRGHVVGQGCADRDFHTLENGGKSVTLTALEFRLLWYLAENVGKLLTRAQILERVWNDVSGVPTRVVDVHVAALRKKLNEVTATLAISSVRGIGYRLDER